MKDKVEHRLFDVVRRPNADPVQWEIIDNEVRGDTIHIICIDENGNPEVLRYSVSHGRLAPHDPEYYSVINLHAQRDREATQQTEMVPQAGPGINLQFQLSPEGEGRLLEWLKTASSVPNDSSKPSSAETPVLNLSDLSQPS